jgi:hypothetical protein
MRYVQSAIDLLLAAAFTVAYIMAGVAAIILARVMPRRAAV